MQQWQPLLQLPICQACAIVLTLLTTVLQEDVDEAHRLMRASKKSLFEACEHNQQQADPLSAIYASLRDDSQARGKHTYVWAELLSMFQRRFTVGNRHCCSWSTPCTYG